MPTTPTHSHSEPPQPLCVQLSFSDTRVIFLSISCSMSVRFPSLPPALIILKMSSPQILQILTWKTIQLTSILPPPLSRRLLSLSALLVPLARSATPFSPTVSTPSQCFLTLAIRYTYFSPLPKLALCAARRREPAALSPHAGNHPRISYSCSGTTYGVILCAPCWHHVSHARTPAEVVLDAPCRGPSRLSWISPI